MILGGVWELGRCSSLARVNPLSPPRSTSTSVTSGRNSSTRWIASAIVDAAPMIEIPPPRSSSLVATSINAGLSSTITQRNSCSPDAITPVSLTRTVVPIPASYTTLGTLGTLGSQCEFALDRLAESFYPSSPAVAAHRCARPADPDYRYPALLDSILADWPRPCITADLHPRLQRAGNPGGADAPERH